MQKEFNFLNYLKNQGLYYKNNIIEEFLLSMKIDNILFLNGDSGTGKTSLAEQYVKYYNNLIKNNEIIESESKIGKTKTSKGFAVRRQDVLHIIPPNKYEEYCVVKVKDINIKGRLNISPRFFFNPNENEEFLKYLDGAKEEGKNKFKYSIILDEALKTNYIIINAERLETMKDQIISFIDKAQKDISNSYFLIFDSVNDENFSKIFYKSFEIPSNLTIIYTGKINNMTQYLNDLSLINFESQDPLDYLQFNTENIEFKNTNYLENIKKENNLNINGLKSSLEKIEIEKNKKLFNTLLGELTNIYYILEEDNIHISTQCINKILKFMYISYQYEDNPEYFTNWKKYFDFQITQRIIPLFYNNEKVSPHTIKKLVDYSNSSYKYYRTHNMLIRMIDRSSKNGQ